MNVPGNITPGQLKRLNQLLTQLGKQAYKIDYVVEVTNGRESSSRGLTWYEANRLIKILEDEQGFVKEDSADKMRKKIISMGHEMGLHVPGTTQIDMQLLGALVLDRGYLKKSLNEYTVQELPKLVIQFERILSHWYKKQTV